MTDLEYNYTDSHLQNNSTLVLCLEERDNKKSYDIIDNRIFIFWEQNSKQYYLFGRRQTNGFFSGVPYAFTFFTSRDVCEFINTTFENRTCSMSYYNFNNLYSLDYGILKPINYEFFENNMDRNYEVIAYDGITIDYKTIQTKIRLLKNTYSVFNY
jgi:hypothetical protein